MIKLIPQGQRIWQTVASAYRPPNAPFALYGEDARMGEYHAGTLGLNFALHVNTLPLHNAWLTGDWFGGYPLRLPDEAQMADFPRMVTPQQAASGIGYAPEPLLAQRIPRSDVPAWVQAYYDYLQNQVDVYGSVIRRETRAEFF